MKINRLGLLFVLVISGCFFSKFYLAVDQVMFRVRDGNSRALVDDIRKQLKAMDFNDRASFFQERNDSAENYYWYESDHDTYASIQLEAPDCVHFAMSVPSDTKDRSSAHSDFATVMKRLNRNSSWVVANGYICQKRP